MFRSVLIATCVLLLSLLGTELASAQQSAIRIPEVIRLEHEHLHEDLAAAMNAGGRTGEAARQVQQALAGHFEEENRLVMPLLGLLKPLAENQASEDMRPAVELSEEVRQKLPRFMEERQAIHSAASRLVTVAEAEEKPEVAEFGRRLGLHAQQEEAVLYPAAILVGQLVENALESETASP